MRRPPPVNEFAKYPVAGGTIALAIGVTVAAWSGKVDVSPLYETVDIRRGELWRLLTSALPHADILHLAFNVYWTWVFGTLVEEIFGHLKLLGILVLLAVAANGAEYAILSGGEGLSGIGYGLFALIWVLSSRDERFAGVIDQKTIGLFVVWFFACIVMTMGGYPIGNIAHGVGAITEGLLGLAIASSATRRIAWWSGLVVLVAAILVGATVARPWINLSKYGGYDEAKLGYEALNDDRNEDALRWFRDATIMQPRIATDWFDMGVAYDRLHRHSQAVIAYKRARDLEPSNAEYQAAARDAGGYGE